MEAPILTDLHFELLTNILIFLKPLNIIVVSRVGTILLHDAWHEITINRYVDHYIATQVRALWLKVARINMDEHGVLQLMLPLDKLDTEALRHFATSSARFSNLVKSHQEDAFLFPVSSRVLLGPNMQDLSLGIEEVSKLHGHFLIPGDRQRTPSESCSCAVLNVMDQPSCLRSRNFDAYHINLDHASTALCAHPVDRLVTNEAIVAFICYGTRVAAVDRSGMIVVWDFINRLATSWNIDQGLLVPRHAMTNCRLLH